MALVLPFPSTARPHELANIVARVAAVSDDEAHDRLVNLMVPIARRMQRARVGEAHIRRDLAALEAAVWSHVARPSCRRGDGA